MSLIRLVVTYKCKTWMLLKRYKENYWTRKYCEKYLVKCKNKKDTYRILMNFKVDKLIHQHDIVRFIKSPRLRWLGYLHRAQEQKSETYHRMEARRN